MIISHLVPKYLVVQKYYCNFAGEINKIEKYDTD